MVDTPTSADVIERFPAFAGQETAIDLLIPEAMLYVNDRWPEEMQQMAILYMVAHLLTTEESASSAGGEVQSESFSLPGISESVTYRKDGSSLNASVYGQRYLALFKRAFGTGTVVVVP